jgi:hypothetical protein
MPGVCVSENSPFITALKKMSRKIKASSKLNTTKTSKASIASILAQSSVDVIRACMRSIRPKDDFYQQFNSTAHLQFPLFDPYILKNPTFRHEVVYAHFVGNSIGSRSGLCLISIGV